MTIYLVNHNFQYACQHIAKVFSDQVNIESVNTAFTPPATQHVVSRVLFFADKIVIKTALQSGLTIDYAVSAELNQGTDKSNLKRAVSRGLFDCLAFYFRHRPAWGILVGVRPTKLVHSMLDKGQTVSQISKILANNYYLSSAKINLLLEICQIERPVLASLEKNSFSMYIGIPFCPTRCVYCSFTSNITQRGSAEIDRYVAALLDELKGLRSALKDKYIDTLYFGGGTPAMLTSEQIDHIFSAIKRYYRTAKIREITFEAGRPKLIDTALLNCLQRNNVSRLCINPQTMHDSTLKKINRLHSVADIGQAFERVAKYGFDAVNGDIIAGLADEDATMFEQSIKQLLHYKPANITVHTLALKRGSKLAEQRRGSAFTSESIVREQLAVADVLLRQRGYHPYYMYRQKYMLGNLENIGYSLAEKISIYNIAIMEERQSIIAFGAGTTSKLVGINNSIERLHNPKNVKLYIDSIEKIIAKKKAALIN